jgi:hypothetical protein
MAIWYNTKYGKAPYKEVLRVVFSFEGIDQIDIAYKQYQLLLNDNIIQAHMEFATKEGIALMVPGTNPEQVLKKEEIKYQILDRIIIPYEEVLAANNMFVESK